MVLKVAHYQTDQLIILNIYNIVHLIMKAQVAKLNRIIPILAFSVGVMLEEPKFWLTYLN